MRLLFAGTPAVAAVSLSALLSSRHEVVAVLTRPDAPAGRGRRLASCPVADLARESGIDVLSPASTRDPDLVAWLSGLAVDCAPVVAFGGLIPGDLLGIPLHGWVNLHFSLLPHWRGAAPVQHAIWHGDDVTGATTFALDEGLDTGPVYGTVTEAIRSSDTAGDLLGRLAESGSGLLVATLDAIEEGRIVPVAQRGEPTMAPKIRTDDARVRWDLPSIGVDRQIRASTPVPGAWTELAGDRVRIGPVQPFDDAPVLPPGEVLVSRRDVVIGTGTVAVRLGDVQPSGKRLMPAADWARGTRLASGDRLA